jgi:hypothetical protein
LQLERLVRNSNRNTINNDHYVEGLSDAIATLEDMPSRCEVDAKSDLISRADAIEAVRKLNDISCDEANRLARIQHADMWKDDIIRNRAECYGYQKAMEAIEALPSAERLYTHEEAWGMTDLISRAKLNDCVKAWYEEMGVDLHGVCNKQLAKIVKEKDEDDLALDFHSLVASINALPSAETETTVIRSKTLMPTKDFKEWAKRIREENPNVIVIPCDAEVVSAEAVQGWIPFTRRPMTEEEQKDYPNCTFMFDCVLPDDGDEILVSNGRFVWMDVFCNDIDGCYLDSGDDIDEDMAWMPLPEPYKGGEK